MKIHKMQFFAEDDGGAGGGAPPAAVVPDPGTPAVVPAVVPPVVTPSAGFVGEDGAFVEGWTDRLPEEMGDSRSTFGKFKSLPDMAKSYRELETRLGKPPGVTVPGENAKPEEVAAYRKAVGALDTVEDYAKIRPENLPEGLEFSEELSKPMFELAHRYNIPAAAVKEFVEMQAQQEEGRIGATTAELQRQLDEGAATLKKDWCPNYDKNLLRVEQAARMAGIDPTTAPGFRDPETLKGFLRLSEKLSDDEWKKGGTTNSPGMSAKDIQTNPSNPLYDRYQKGDPDVVAQVRSLLKRGL